MPDSVINTGHMKSSRGGRHIKQITTINSDNYKQLITAICIQRSGEVGKACGSVEDKFEFKA